MGGGSSFTASGALLSFPHASGLAHAGLFGVVVLCMPLLGFCVDLVREDSRPEVYMKVVWLVVMKALITLPLLLLMIPALARDLDTWALVVLAGRVSLRGACPMPSRLIGVAQFPVSQALRNVVVLPVHLVVVSLRSHLLCLHHLNVAPSVKLVRLTAYVPSPKLGALG